MQFRYQVACTSKFEEACDNHTVRDKQDDGYRGINIVDIEVERLRKILDDEFENVSKVELAGLLSSASLFTTARSSVKQSINQKTCSDFSPKMECCPRLCQQGAEKLSYKSSWQLPP